MTAWEWYIAWCVLVLAFAASALCSGLEVGTYAVNRVRLAVRSARTPPDEGAQLLRAELEKPARVLVALLIANNIVNAIAAEAAAGLLNSSGYSTLAIAIINTLVLGPLLFVLGDALPKEIFRVDADRLTPALARVLRLLRVLLTVTLVLPLVQWFAHVLEKLLKLPADASTSARERVAQLLKEGAGAGVLSESQTTLLDRALAFRDVRVADELVPWASVLVIPASADRARMLELTAGSEHAHFPVVDRTGRVQGVIRHLDLYAQTKKPVADLVTPALRLRPETPARDALAALHRAKARIAIVEDASGRAVGIVTPKDLIEPLTGELLGL